MTLSWPAETARSQRAEHVKRLLKRFESSLEAIRLSSAASRWCCAGPRSYSALPASLHPFPLFGAMWNPFENVFGAPVFGHGATVIPLQLVSDEKWEVLEAFQAHGSISIVEALIRQARNSDWIRSSMRHVVMRDRAEITGATPLSGQRTRGRGDHDARRSHRVDRSRLEAKLLSHQFGLNRSYRYRL